MSDARLWKMPLHQRLTGFASAMLVVLIQLALGGGGALVCADHLDTPATRGAHAPAASMADMPGMGAMPGMPAHGDTGPVDEDGCPESGMPTDDCRAMSACTSIVAVMVELSSTAAAPVPPSTIRVVQLAPLSLALPPESPPPRA